jgi:glucosamine--fructose-6-phosphate aminotransferase (isomerizing)
MSQSRSVGAEPFTHQEIISQPAAWEQALQVVGGCSDALAELWASGRYTSVLFTGCGSTHYLALAAAALFQQLTGVPTRGVPAGELVMYPGAAYSSQDRTLLIALSRSAETTETVRAVEAFREEWQGTVIVVTNYGDRPLAQRGTLTLTIPAGREQSIAQTRSFASMYVASTALAATIAGRQDLLQAMAGLPAVGERLIEEYEELARRVGSDLDLDRFYFLGSGPRYGLACEANLKMKEMSLTHSEPFHFLEFRHGPKSMAGSTALVAGLLSDACRDYEAAVLDEVRGLGARMFVLAEGADGRAVDVAFHSGLPEPVRNVLYLPVLQLTAYYRSLAKGLNPDRPHNLDAVVKLA